MSIFDNRRDHLGQAVSHLLSALDDTGVISPEFISLKALVDSAQSQLERYESLSGKFYEEQEEEQEEEQGTMSILTVRSER